MADYFTNNRLSTKQLNDLNRKANVGMTPGSSDGIQVSSSKYGVNLTLDPQKSPRFDVLEINVINVSDYPIIAFAPIVLNSSEHVEGDEMYSNPFVYGRPAYDWGGGANDHPIAVCQEDIPVGEMAKCVIAGACMALVIGTGAGYSCGLDALDLNYFYTSNTKDKRFPILWEESGDFTVPHKALIILGNGGGTAAAETPDPGTTNIDIVATLPAIPNTGEDRKLEVFWGKSTTITGGTGDDQIWWTWAGTHRHLRWYPTLPTTKNGTPGV